MDMDAIPSAGPLRDWVVMKFGGTSVGNPALWPTIENEIGKRLAAGERPLVVCSALAGVSNALEHLLAAASDGAEIAPLLERIRDKHHDFAAALGIDGDAIIARELDRVAGLLERPGVGPVPAHVQAEVMVTGELLSTQLAAIWLQRRGVEVAWRDARDMLTVEPLPPGASDDQAFLLARCSDERDASLSDELGRLPQDAVVLTQGFMARNAARQTVLLGRGGSDTAAAYFAARVNARRLEIWTDVPGMFTTNPANCPNARLLKSLSYDEAETLAGMGAKVLHPHCIQPVRANGIPLHIRWTTRPDLPGTVIQAALTDHANGVKAVSSRKSLALISMNKRDGWQPVGFMADVAACFKKHALSIDLLASSSTNIRATIDLTTAPQLENSIGGLVEDLSKVCRPFVHEDVASISLVGHAIRSTVHELAPTIAAMEEQQLMMMTQAANDLTVSFVVPADEVDDLVGRLHEILFESLFDDEHFGPTWAELQHENELAAAGR